MKQIIIVGLIVLLSMSNVSAGTAYKYENFDGDTTPSYPNNGFIYVYADRVADASGGSSILSSFYQTGGHTTYYKVSGNSYARAGVSPNQYIAHIDFTPEGSVASCNIIDGTCTNSFSGSYNTTSSYRIGAYASNFYNQFNSYTDGVMYVKTTPFLDLTVSGGTCGISSADLYLWTGSEYNLINESSLNTCGDSYNFDIVEDQSYRLVFSDAHQYDFTPTTSSITYNRDLCDYYTINLLDNCANPLINPHTTIFKNMTEIIYEGDENPISLIIPDDINISDYLQIIIDTCDGAVQYNDYVSVIEQDLYHNFVAWDMNIHVVDDNTGSDIVGAQVVLSQDCAIDLPNTKNVISTATGHAMFTGLSNSNMGVSVTKTGYNTYSKTILVGSIFNAWSTGGSFSVYMNSTTGDSSDNFNNGTHDDTSADGTSEETLSEDHGYGCGVYFKNTDGVITDTINDTDTHVDMYWWIKGSDATLKFQHQIYTYWYTDEEYSVSNNTFEYRRILNANFSDYTNAYRGYIYNATQDCNSIQRLYVINQTYEAETDYKNLTSHCWIKNKLSGNEIDYRSDIKCIIYANSTNSSLLNITAHFMNQSTEVDSIVLNWADFVSGSPKWYYIWYPTYKYESGYNYTLNITGFDGCQLDTDEVWTADIIGNTLTVYVKDNHNTPLAYSTIFVQGWGSVALDASTDVSITGLSNGNVQYKATKSGYLSSAWSNITLDGSDESVTCILTESATESVTGYKLKDSEIKEFFIPLMYMLLIMILLGGLTNAAKK